MDRPLGLVQGTAAAAPGHGDDLGEDGDGDFFGGVGAEVEADRGTEAVELVLLDAQCPEAFYALGAGVA